MLLSVEAEVVLQLTIENKEVSSGKSLKSDIGHCLKLLIQIKKNKDPNTDPIETPAFMNFQLEFWPFNS